MLKQNVKKHLDNFKKFWAENFLTRPSNFKALRITVSVMFSLILFYSLGFLKEGLLVGMGIVAAAITENDVHIKSVFRSILMITGLFFVFSALTKILSPHPWIFGFFLVTSTFLLTIAGGYKPKYASFAFGSVLIIIYTLIIHTPDTAWYVTPILISIGVIIYMITTVLVFLLNPFQNLKNEITLGYRMLGEYMKTKSKFFPSTTLEQEEIRNELALINVELFSQTEKIKVLLQQFDKVITKNQRKEFGKYIYEWNRLQTLHEKAVSSHEPYDLISQKSGNMMLVKGFGKLLYEIGYAAEAYAVSIFNNYSYKTPSDLKWTKNALEKLVDKHSQNQQNNIPFLFKNISSIEENLFKNKDEVQPILNEKPDKITFKELFSVNNSRFRHAVRLSLCFLTGYFLMIYFKIDLGAWILLTSLIVCQQTYNATRQRFFKRIIGTLVGVVIGIFLAILVPTTLGQLLILIVSIYLFFKFINLNYTIAAVFITIYVLEVYNLQNGSGISVMLPRIIDTLLGSVLAYLSIRFIWPEWQYKNLKPLLIKAIDKNIQYFEGVMNKNITDDEYLHNQRSVHRADNSLTQVWKGMRIEPKSKRKLLTSARNFTYLNHSLISYISALGVHRKNLNFSEEDFAQQKEIIQKLNDIKSYIQDNQNIHLKRKTIIRESLENQPKNSDNQLFLKNILNVSNDMKQAVLELKF